jgi:hypothetical protein
LILALLLAIAPTDDLLPGTNAATAALFEALEANDAKAVKKALARKGVDVNARTAREADTPLMLAANLGSVELVKALLAAGADPNKAPHSRYHHAPLFYALMGNKLTRDEKTLEAINGVVKVLLDAKADPNLEMVLAEGMPKTTPTLVAAGLDPSTFALFLAAGGSPSVTQSDGKDAVAIALEEVEEAVTLEKLELSLRAGWKPPEAEKARARLLASALDRGHAAAVRRLIGVGCVLPEGSELRPWLVAGAAAAGDEALYDERARPRLQDALRREGARRRGARGAAQAAPGPREGARARAAAARVWGAHGRGGGRRRRGW